MTLHILVAVLAIVMTGCSNKYKKMTSREQPVENLTLTAEGEGVAATQPTTRAIPVMVIQNDAVIQRQWPEAVFWRASGDVIAGPTYWESVNSAFKRSDWENVVMEPGEFLLNTVLLPIRAVITPPGTPIVYSPVGPKMDETTARKWKK